MNDNRITIRLFAAVPDEIRATEVAKAAEQKLAVIGRICVSQTQRYWKIPEYFELFFNLEPHGDIINAFQSILDALATGWQAHRFPTGGDWAVWNATDSAISLLPLIRWANVECYREA